MLDIEIKNFYNDIKDSAWPNIQNYADFLKLPNGIQKECNEIYNFQQRKNEIINVDHWVQLTTEIYVYKDLAYVPVPKCAYSYYTTLFTNLGWKKVNINDVDIQTTKFFGTVMHPMTRWLKGITEWIVESYTIGNKTIIDSWTIEPGAVDWKKLEIDLQTDSFKKLISTVNVGDIHSMPYSAMFGNLLNKITWIPMDILTDDEIKISMMNFFKLHKHGISIPLNHKRLHESTPNKLKLFNNIKSQYVSNKNQIYLFYKLYSNDLKFYYTLLDNFNPTWANN